MNHLATKETILAFKYNPEISLGTIAEIVSLIIIATGAYAVLSANDARHDARLNEHDKELVRIQKNYDDLTNNIHSDIKDLGTSLKLLDSKITQVMIDQARNENARRATAARVQ